MNVSTKFVLLNPEWDESHKLYVEVLYKGYLREYPLKLTVTPIQGCWKYWLLESEHIPFETNEWIKHNYFRCIKLDQDGQII